MNLIDLQNTVIDALEDIKGQNIQVFDAQPLTSMFDRVVIVSGTSNRQTRALAKHLHDKVKQAGGSVLSTEGEDTGEWVLVDLGDVIVHIMQPTIREYYALEELWGKYLVDWQAERTKAKPAPRRKATAKKPITEKTKEKKAAKVSSSQPTAQATAKAKGAKPTASKGAAKPPSKATSSSGKAGAKKAAAKPSASKTSAKPKAAGAKKSAPKPKAAAPSRNRTASKPSRPAKPAKK
jgi:ribosome-associated protein